MSKSGDEIIGEFLAKINYAKLIGYILLSPAVISVFIFFYDLLIEKTSDFIFSNLNYRWVGGADWSQEFGGGGGYTSALPFYFGLMAIAGAYLIKDNKKD